MKTKPLPPSQRQATSRWTTQTKVRLWVAGVTVATVAVAVWQTGEVAQRLLDLGWAFLAAIALLTAKALWKRRKKKPSST